MDNYIVSARKYRPMTFSSVVGQDSLTMTLKNSVKSGKLAHAYLFCGPRGVGKTTCARIFAKTINCENPTTDGEACNECASCKAFNEGRSMNIFELDAASNNKVENIKSLMDQTLIPPQTGRYKVFIIDEVHMLSTSAFNAFLKTLEEPPQYVIFILATTEKNKILPTILSRCQIYDFERMTIPEIVNQLTMVAQKENITFEEEALALIAEKADGGMRDALSIFDQVSSFCQGHITFKKVLEDLNVLDADNYFRIIDMALENKTTDIMLLLNNIITRGFDGGNIITGLASHVRNVMMARDKQTLPLLEVSELQRQKYHQQAQKCSDKFLFRALKILNDCDISYRQSSNKRLLVELTLIRVAQITQPEDDDSAGAGLSPNRLKSLFKNILVSQPKTAMQVAGVEKTLKKSTYQKSANEKSEETDNEKNNAVKLQPQQIADITTRKKQPQLANIGVTFARLKQDPVISDELNVIKVDEKQSIIEEKRFTEADLSVQWTLMCNRMPQNFVGLASRLKNLVPRITSYPNFEVVVDNNILLEHINQIRGKIRATMRQTLNHKSIEFSVRLANQDELKKTFTKREVFDDLRKRNPAFEKLRTKLGLELA
ncbi:MAG: DNA polymerase III subunit gamma/tau [Prevotellaceae bacterium]|nr:DNA polymerase III subunit gamma/tau [Prevotellaceae bacterium]